MGQRKKNQRKTRNKRRCQERRASESENSEGEAEKEREGEIKTDKEEQKSGSGPEDNVPSSSSTGERSPELQGSGEPGEMDGNASASSPCAEPQPECWNAGNPSKQSLGKERRKNRKGVVPLQPVVAKVPQVEFGSNLIFDLDM